ncbi:hypothetical protein LCI18_013013 [Fusarium solani-melongenae]|uniref:Uncharacterized protein n=1 Tax=Fusarium solani subsp. cucurbitae TaxID=2747967 RepID=A0ACD3ZPR0_FUSSC|nr:hypothetical protein LCI18_013013 [Fusarium solani-melongenae]
MSSNAEASKAAQRVSRALACAQCRRRKIKCDHDVPCTSCLKANVKCTPFIPAPTRRPWKASRGFQERLGRCEALLENLTNHASPSASENDPQHLSHPSISQYQRTSNSTMPTALDPYKKPALGCDISSHKDNTPDPELIFRLWHVYLERVNPLTKIIHVPTLQPYVTEATTNPHNIPQNYQCLLCAVSLMAIVSLDEPECQGLLGIPRSILLQALVARTRQTLLEFDLFRNHDMAVLQALVLFLISLEDHCDKQTAWIFGGTVLRIATNMGYHRDGELLHLTPLETEMRRRIWWQILLQDASLTGMGQKIFQGVFDTKQPQNFNDADLFPGCTRPVKPRDGPTEMGFVLVINRVMEFVMDPGRTSEKDDKALTTERFLDLDRALQEMEWRYINASVGGVHILAKAFRSIILTNLLNILEPVKDRPEGDIMTTPDHTFPEATVTDNDRSADFYTCIANYGFTWFARRHALVSLVSHLQ